MTPTVTALLTEKSEFGRSLLEWWARGFAPDTEELIVLVDEGA
jgi:hypothetical protein